MVPGPRRWSENEYVRADGTYLACLAVVGRTVALARGLDEPVGTKHRNPAAILGVFRVRADQIALLELNGDQDVRSGGPGARFVPLPSANHILLAEEPAWNIFREELASFLKCKPFALTPPKPRT